MVDKVEENNGEAAGSDTTTVDNKNLSDTDSLMLSNPEDTTCYCGKDRDLTVAEYQCGMCLRYYHEQCVSSIEPNTCVPFLTNYQFFCKRCSVQESFSKKPASFGQMCLTALANLTEQNPGQKFFSRDKDILPYIETNWEKLTTAVRRVKNTWHSSIGKTMSKDPVIFMVEDEASPNCDSFGLVNQDLTKIGPNCESLFRLTCVRTTETKTTSVAEAKNRVTGKRKAAGDVVGLKQKRGGDVSSSTRLTPRCYPLEHPFNKDGYRYHLAEPDPHAANWQVFDESQEWAGRPIPGCLYRFYLEPRVLLSLNDRAPQLKLSDDRLSVTGEKGYSMLRATHGVKTGSWYYEVTIQDMPPETATRIGWSQSLGNLQAPCGYDKFSYSWRSRKGTLFHQSRGKHYSDVGYVEKDVLGFYIHLPPLSDPGQLAPSGYKEMPLVKFKSHFYYEEKDYVSETEKKLKEWKGTKMVMYKNGVSQGVAFEDFFGGIYYPALSLYKSVTVSVNFGPNFKHPPKDLRFRPISDAAEQDYVYHSLGDLVYHVEHEGQQLEL